MLVTPSCSPEFTSSSTQKEVKAWKVAVALERQTVAPTGPLFRSIPGPGHAVRRLKTCCPAAEVTGGQPGLSGTCLHHRDQEQGPLRSNSVGTAHTLSADAGKSTGAMPIPDVPGEHTGNWPASCPLVSTSVSASFLRLILISPPGCFSVAASTCNMLASLINQPSVNELPPRLYHLMLVRATTVCSFPP